MPKPGAGVPLNQYLIHLESDLFEGKMMLYVRGLPSSSERYFAGKKRRSVFMVQVKAACTVRHTEDNWGHAELPLCCIGHESFEHCSHVFACLFSCPRAASSARSRWMT